MRRTAWTIVAVGLPVAVALAWPGAGGDARLPAGEDVAAAVHGGHGATGSRPPVLHNAAHEEAGPPAQGAVPRVADEELEEPGLFPAPDAARIAALLHEFVEPTEPTSYSGLLMSTWPDYAYMEEEREIRRCRHAMEALVEAGPSEVIDSGLLGLLHRAPDVRTRLRALETLIRRGYPLASPVFRQYVGAKREVERYVAWDSAHQARRRGHGAPILSAAEAATCHAAETHPDTALAIEGYVATLPADEALPVLVGWLRGDDPACAERAFGTLGARYAEAAEPYLRAHVAQHGTPDGWREAVDPPANADVATLHAEWVRLQAAPAEPKRDKRIRDLRVELARRDAEDPPAALFALLESASDDPPLRRAVVSALHDLLRARRAAAGPDLALEARLAARYRTEPRTEVCDLYFHALKDSRARGVTEGMVHHLLEFEGGSFKTSHPSEVLWQLTRRLGRPFASVEDVQRHLEEQRRGP